MTSLRLFAAVLAAATLPLGAVPSSADTFQKHPTEPVDLTNDRNLYVVGYAHLDTQWRWTYPYVIQNFIRNTLEQNFPLLDKYPNYVFNFTGSRRYEFMKDYFPEDYQRLKKYVAEGRWVPSGSSVDECDVNTPSCESLVRQMLYGNHFFQREFGKQCEDFLLPDCFGFPFSLPTILAHGGIKGFSTQKLTWGSAVGIPFNVGVWIGTDGSSVLAALNPGGYGGSVSEDLSKSANWHNRIDGDGEKSGVYADYMYYGTGDRGGAPGESSVQWIERSIAGNGPVRVIAGSSDQIFRDITPAQAAHLPTYKGELELVNHSAGSISSEAYMKRWNRKNEQLANGAESAATAAAWLGAFRYPSDALYRAWDLVLGSQMHDILPGTSLPRAYQYSWNDEVLALNQFASVEENATAAVLSTLDTRTKGIAVAVYNPLPIQREDPVDAYVPLQGAAPQAMTAYDPQGKPVPTQILGQEGGKLHVLFLAKVPSVGYAIYDLVPGASPEAGTLAVTPDSLENARYRVTLNDAGDISSIFDKSLNREMLSAPVRLSIHTENPSQFPAWNMDWDDRQKPARDFVGGPAKITVIEKGPARVALKVERTAEDSVFTQEIRLAAGSAGDRVEILNHIDWRTKEACLKTDFPLSASNPQATFDDKVGVIRRGNDNPKAFELAQQQWMDLTNTDGSYGVSILNDSKFGSDKPDDHTLRSTMLYTPGTRGGYQDQGTQDQGRHEILLAFAAHQGDWVAGHTPWQAARLNQPLRAFLPATAHAGPLGRTFSLLSISSDQVQAIAIKKAEDSNELIVRFKELTGNPASGIQVRFPAAILGGREVDGQERPLPQFAGAARLRDGALEFSMRPFSLRAFALRLAAAPATASRIVSQSVPLPFNVVAISTRAHRYDGAMDGSGGSFPGELLPARLTCEGVDFTLGSSAAGNKNALAAAGQSIDLPAGGFNRVHLLAAADGDTSDQIKIGDTGKEIVVPNWTGFVGQWDTRLWDSPIPELDYGPTQKMVGLVPGFVKRTPVAWYATYHNTPQGDAYYQYSYLFELSYDLPDGAKTLTLPNNSKIRVFALTVSNEPSAAPAAAPLYDTLADHQPEGAPAIPQAGQTFTKSTDITLLPPLYYRPHELHYTLDGSEPTASSPVYDGPFLATDTVNIAVRQIDGAGNGGPVARGVVTVHDSTPPELAEVVAGKSGNSLDLNFSKPLTPATVQDTGNYVITPALPVAKVARSADGRQVTLTFGAPIAEGVDYTLSLHGLRDTTPNGNLIQPVTRPFNAGNIVYNLPSADLPAGALKTAAPGLPVRKSDSWTMNMLVKTDVRPPDRSVIAGFGQDSDVPGGEGARYFATFSDGIRFWSSGRDVNTNSPLDLGRWQMLTATYDGRTVAVYKDGQPIMKKEVEFAADSDPSVSIGPADPWDHQRRFEGSVRDFTIRRGALSSEEVRDLFDKMKPPQ